VRVQIVHHQHHLLGVRIAHLQQVADLLGEIDRGAPLGHGDVAVPGQRFARQEQVGGSAPFVFVIDPFGLAGFGRAPGSGSRPPTAC
jgi:hypothetical protein